MQETNLGEVCSIDSYAQRLSAALDEVACALINTIEASEPLINVSFSFLSGPPLDGLQVIFEKGDNHHFSEFAIGVQKGILLHSVRQMVLLSNHREEGGQGGTVSPLAQDMLGGGASTLLSRQAILNLSPSEVAVMLLALPAHGILWSRRREYVNAVLCREENNGRPILECLCKEYVLTSVLLSAVLKVKEVWVYRSWIVSQWINYYYSTCHGIREEDRQGLIGRLALQDNVLFCFAAENHRLNYNAWQYRREVYIARSIHTSDQCALLTEEMNMGMRFLRTNNGDSSAVSYLLFLLRHAETVHVLPFLHDCWRQLLSFTQLELRLRADKGHECMWYLRLELVKWALRQTSLSCGWTVEEELNWVSAFVDGAAGGLLTPVNVARDAWVRCSGDGCWSSYYACRYGLQLISVIKGGAWPGSC